MLLYVLCASPLQRGVLGQRALGDAFTLACKRGHTDIVELLLERTAIVGPILERDRRSLVAAAKYGNLACYNSFSRPHLCLAAVAG